MTIVFENSMLYKQLVLLYVEDNLQNLNYYKIGTSITQLRVIT